MEDLNGGFLSTALWEYNVEILSTIYDVEGLEVKAFGGRSLKVRALLCEESGVWGLLASKVFGDSAVR